jgi:hypothetical protein
MRHNHPPPRHAHTPDPQSRRTAATPRWQATPAAIVRRHRLLTLVALLLVAAAVAGCSGAGFSGENATGLVSDCNPNCPNGPGYATHLASQTSLAYDRISVYAPDYANWSNGCTAGSYVADPDNDADDDGYAPNDTDGDHPYVAVNDTAQVNADVNAAKTHGLTPLFVLGYPDNPPPWYEVRCAVQQLIAHFGTGSLIEPQNEPDLANGGTDADTAAGVWENAVIGNGCSLPASSSCESNIIAGTFASVQRDNETCYPYSYDSRCGSQDPPNDVYPPTSVTNSPAGYDLRFLYDIKNDSLYTLPPNVSMHDYWDTITASQSGNSCQAYGCSTSDVWCNLDVSAEGPCLNEFWNMLYDAYGGSLPTIWVTESGNNQNNHTAADDASAAFEDETLTHLAEHVFWYRFYADDPDEDGDGASDNDCGSDPSDTWACGKTANETWDSALVDPYFRGDSHWPAGETPRASYCVLDGASYAQATSSSESYQDSAGWTIPCVN